MTKVIEFSSLEKCKKICFAVFLICCGMFISLAILNLGLNKQIGAWPWSIVIAGWLIFGILFLLLEHEMRIKKIEKRLNDLEGKH